VSWLMMMMMMIIISQDTLEYDEDDHHHGADLSFVKEVTSYVTTRHSMR
jgi:hypothetical protein